MHIETLRKMALALTFWLALHMTSLRATVLPLGPYGTSPTSFEVDTNGLLSDTGVFGTGTLSLSGAGTSMIWYPGKAAFRAGTVSGTDWDDANIGNYSVAFGMDNIASGQGSVALGKNNTASSYESVALGYGNISSTYQSTALGYYTTASGYGSTASGSYTTASAYDSFVMGEYNVGGGNPSSWVLTDPLFEVGNGTDSGHLHDALLLDKSGNLTVSGNMAAASVTVTAPSGDIPMYTTSP